jgi:hypothetical protein
MSRNNCQFLKKIVKFFIATGLEFDIFVYICRAKLKKMANEIFISYSRKDYDTVRKIKTDIDRKVGIDCWMGLDDIDNDAPDLAVANEEAFDAAQLFLFMLSENSQDAIAPRKEIALAQKKGKRIAVVKIDDSRLSSDFIIHYYQYRQYNYAKDRERTKLMQDISSWVSVKETPRKPEVPKPEQPEPMAQAETQEPKTKATDNTTTGEAAWGHAWAALRAYESSNRKRSTLGTQPIEPKAEPKKQWQTVVQPKEAPAKGEKDDAESPWLTKVIAWIVILYIIYLIFS